MGNEINTEKMYINGVDIEEYSARALREIKIGGTKRDNDYFQGRNRTHYTLMNSTFGLKPVSFTLVYHGKFYRDAMLNKSECEAQMFGECDLFMPDGFHYRCMLESIGESVTKGIDGQQVIIETNYKLSGIQHDELVVVEDGTSFISKGTMPRMDCRLTVTVGEDAETYRIGGAVFKNVVAGDVLVVDGIYKRFLKNGAWTTADSWINFPSVVSGQNAFIAPDTVQVEYYPCYI